MKQNLVSTTKTTFRIIDTLNNTEGMAITEIADELGLAKSTVHKHLQTLREDQYVVKDGNTYRLGLRFLEIGELTRNKMAVYEKARSEIDQLAETTGELANLMIEENGRGVYVYTTSGDQAVSLDTYPGRQVSLHSTALGKALLANMSDEKVDRIIDRYGLEEYTEHTITDRDDLMRELEGVREVGVAFDHQERIMEMCCVAAPILVGEREVAGALSVTGPISRVGGDRLENEIADKVKRAANITSINHQYG